MFFYGRLVQVLRHDLPKGLLRLPPHQRELFVNRLVQALLLTLLEIHGALFPVGVHDLQQTLLEGL